MLKIKDDRFGASAPRWGLACVATLLAAAVIGVSALRCPAQKAGEAAVPPSVVTFVDGGTVEEKAAAPEPEPFDISCMPPDAMGVVCFRPSAVLSRSRLKHYAEAADKALAEACKGFGMPRAFGPSVGDIAQVTMGISIKTDPKAKQGQTALMVGEPLMIRTTKDFDWAAEIKALLPGVKEERSGDRVLYQLPTDGPLLSISRGMKMCCYVPDRRTIVFDTPERIGKRLDGSAPAWAADFRRVERGLAAVVFDNRNGAWARELGAQDKPEPHVAPFQDHTAWLVVGFSGDDAFVCGASAHFDSEEAAEKAEKAIDGWLSGRTALATSPDNASGSLLKALVEKPELKREGASIRIRCHADGDATEWLKGILDEQGGL